MKLVWLFIYSTLILSGSTNFPCDSYAFDKLHQGITNCPPEGNAKSERVKALNRLKNRDELPNETEFDHSVTLESLLKSGDDRNRWSNTKAIHIKGFVYNIKEGGIETCNCKDPNERDIHIELVIDPMQTGKSLRFVAEITPRMRRHVAPWGWDWSYRTLRDKYLGRWVEIGGWLFLDEEHLNMAEHTNPGRPRNWRATAWEIHPITYIGLFRK